MNGFTSFVCLVVALGCGCVNGQVPSSTPCSLSFYRYLYNLPGEKIRPNVPAGTYVFGKRVGPQEDAEASDSRPSFLKPDSRQYLPPSAPSTTFLPPQPVSTTTYRPPPPPPPPPSTSAPIYIPPPPSPPSPYFPEASNTVAVKSVGPADCDSPSHRAPPPSLPRFDLPKLAAPTFFAPQFIFPQQPPRVTVNEIRPPQFKYPVPTPPSRSFAGKPAEDCDKHQRPTPYTSAPSSTTTTTTTAEPLETRQQDVVVIPSAVQTPEPVKPDCGHPEHQPAESQAYGQQSIGVPSEDYGVSAAPSAESQGLGQQSIGVPSEDYGVSAAPSAPLPAPAPSAGYSYDKPSPSFGYPQVESAGYNYPKPVPSFDFPGYSGQATSLFESPAAQSSIAKEDGDLVILKV